MPFIADGNLVMRKFKLIFTIEICNLMYLSLL